MGRRLLALLVAVLCIVVRLGVEVDSTHADEAMALVGPGLVCRTSDDAGAEPAGPTAPDGVTDAPWPWGSFACIALHGSQRASAGHAPARERRGDPKASRGPPSFVVS